MDGQDLAMAGMLAGRVGMVTGASNVIVQDIAMHDGMRAVVPVVSEAIGRIDGTIDNAPISATRSRMAARPGRTCSAMPTPPKPATEATAAATGRSCRSCLSTTPPTLWTRCAATSQRCRTA